MNASYMIPESVIICSLQLLRKLISNKTNCIITSTFIGPHIMNNEWTSHSQKSFLPYKSSNIQWVTRNKNAVPLDVEWIIIPFLYATHWLLVIRHRWQWSDAYYHTFLYIDSNEGMDNEDFIQKKLMTCSDLWKGYRTSHTNWQKIQSTQQCKLE